MDSLPIPCNLTTAVGILVPAALIFFVLIKTWNKSKPHNPAKLPPGPNKLPVIGNLHLISLPPFRCFRDSAKTYGPIMHLQLGQVPLIVVSSPEIAKEILKDNDPDFADRPEGIAVEILLYNYIDMAYCPYGDYWKQMRKICVMELMSARNVRSFAAIRNDEVSRLIKRIHLSAGKPVNLTAEVFSSISSVLCRSAVGKVCQDIDAMSALVKDALQVAGEFVIADLFPSCKMFSALSWTKLRLLMMRRKLDVILDDIIDEHRENLAEMGRERGRDSGNRRGNGEFGNEDLVDVLLRIKDSGEMEFPLGNDNIKALLFDMFTGGTHSTSSTIDWAMTELIRNPRVMAKAQAEVRQVLKGRSNNIEEHDTQKPKYLKLVIRESLRLHPPGPMIPRASRKEREINGYTIPARYKILVNIWAMHRDPEYWTNPESFVPERFEDQAVDFTGGDFEYLPFGSGRRMCPGIALAMANIELYLARLLYNFDWKLPDGVRAEDLGMIQNHGLSATRKENLFLVATPCEPLA